MNIQEHTPATSDAAPTSGCGCGGGCGDAALPVPAPVLTADPRLDVREIPHSRRHATVLDTVGAVPAGGALVLVAPHAPRPVLAEIMARYPDAFAVEWLQSGPEVWQVRLSRVAS